MTGQDKERDLARQLDQSGYHVLRSPASGSVDRDQPDLAYAKSGEITVIELKYTGGNIAYYGGEEVAALRRFAESFGAVAKLAVRWKGDTTFYKIKPDDARRTDSGRYAVDAEMDLAPIFS